MWLFPGIKPSLPAQLEAFPKVQTTPVVNFRIVDGRPQLYTMFFSDKSLGMNNRRPPTIDEIVDLVEVAKSEQPNSPLTYALIEHAELIFNQRRQKLCEEITAINEASMVVTAR